MSAAAPLAIFVYKRLSHLEMLVDSLRSNPEAADSPVYIFCDGAKGAADQAAVDEVRAFADQLQGFGPVTVVKRDQNLGLARSIISGVSAVLQAHERVIVIEDDLLVSPYFLRYMNDGLELYADDSEVASIHGYIFPVAEPLPESFFLRGADCWGWATWRRAWQHFEADGQKLLEQLRQKRLTRAFDLDGAYPYTRMLRHQIAGKNDSWAIRWHASAFLAGMLTLYPGRSLVMNMGLDGSGTHCSTDSELPSQLRDTPLHLRRIARQECVDSRRKVATYLRQWWWRKVWQRLKILAGLTVK